MILFFIVEQRIIKKYEETIKKWMLALVFLTSLIIFLAGVVGIMLVWNFDIANFFNYFLE